LTVHGWLWTIIGSVMLLGVLWVRPDAVTAPVLAVLGLGALDVAAGTLVLRRTRAGRWLLLLTVVGHLALAVWLGYRAQVLAEPLSATPTTPVTHGQLAGKTMLGAVVLFVEGLVAASVLVCSWTLYGLFRSR
jgi:hypothetical protein